MKMFLKRVAAMAALLTLMALVFVSITYILRGRILNYKIPTDKHIVFMGNSQLEMGIDDSKINGAINLAKSAKQYLFMRVDLKNLINENSQIDTVFLVVSPFSIRAEDADRSYEDVSYISSVTYYAPYLTIGDLQELPVSSPFVKDLLFGGCLKYLASPQQCGAYIYNTRNDMVQDKKKHDEGKVLEREKIKNGNAITQLELERISRLCQSNNVKLILISTPNYEAAKNYNLSLFRSQVRNLQKKINIDYWEYVDYPMEDSCYSDMTHLNYKGAAIFTNIIKSRLKR